VVRHQFRRLDFPTTFAFTSLSSEMRRTCTCLLWSRKKAEAARARWPSDLQSRRWRTGSASHSLRRIHKARYRKWKERRDNAYPRVVRVADPAEIDGALSRLEAEGIWLGIIDTAATNNALAMRAIAKADLCLIPVRPSPADIEASIPTLIAIRRLNRRFAFVLNQTPPRGCRLSEAATSLNSLGVLALPYVGQRNDHQDALGTGLGVTEFAQEGRASEEVRKLWRWVLKKLVEGSFDHEQNANKAAC
jgi:chromosome partitioning protein